MYAEDFVYDGVALSDFNFVIANFDQGGLETRDTGSQISLNLVSNNYGKRYYLTGSTYDSCITCTFQICKNPDKYTMSEMAITSDEYRDIVRWLNRREFCKMQFISCADDEEFKEMPYYNATFNVSKLVLAETVYGIELTMQTDSPFGYFDTKVNTLTTSNSTLVTVDGVQYYKYIMTDGSDEIGYSYPDVVITIQSDGKYILKNVEFGTSTEIDNCTAGEVITMHGETHIIESSLSSHNIAKDFNFEFLRIGNTYTSRTNTLLFTTAATTAIYHKPFIKDLT